MYFEGQMNGSEKAEFGRSKQKRSDRRLIGLALSIDGLGFVRHSQFYSGNISEPGTFIDLINSLKKQLKFDSQTEKTIDMFAGSHDAAQRTAVMYSFLGTCAVNNINPTKWIKYVLEKIGSHSANKLKDLLPTNENFPELVM